MIGISRPIVKHSFMVKRSEDLPGIIKKAFHIATQRPAGPGGDRYSQGSHPTGRDLRVSSTRMTVKMRSYSPGLSAGTPGRSRRPPSMLLASKRPVIYAGGGVIQGEGSELLTRLARAPQLPGDQYPDGAGRLPGYRQASSSGCWACTASTRRTWPCTTATCILAVGRAL